MSLNEKKILSGLNESQKEAVTAADGPLLVVAGPGTGKTLTIVRRIAWLVRRGVKPESILAVTFTNRAAREMRERTEALLGKEAGRIFIGTLHLFGLKLLRHALPAGFVLYNRDEQVELLKSLTKESAKKTQQAAEGISRFKNGLNGADVPEDLVAAYQKGLCENNAVDFDDLILLPAAMLQKVSSGGFAGRFSHVMVDEYQDVNPAQYHLLRLLADTGASLCAIGDSDQAIYGFRGADAAAFLSFANDFNGAAVVTLRANYRSTATVLSASDGLIRRNLRRREKDVTATRDAGTPVTIVSVPDERAEAEFIVREIESRIGGTSHDQMRRAGEQRGSSAGSFCFSDFAVLFRTNAQAKALEDAFHASGIPFQVVGRRGGLQTRQIDETLAYLKSLVEQETPADPAALDGNEAKLLAPADYFDPRADAVTLSTLHTAKGLEFKVLFIAGVEDGLIPFTMMRDDADREEERRLFYVGMTRARDELFLVASRSRFLYGRSLSPPLSPFLDEIPEHLTREIVVPDRMKKQKDPDPQMGLF